MGVFVRHIDGVRCERVSKNMLENVIGDLGKGRSH